MVTKSVLVQFFLKFIKNSFIIIKINKGLAPPFGDNFFLSIILIAMDIFIDAILASLAIPLLKKNFFLV